MTAATQSLTLVLCEAYSKLQPVMSLHSVFGSQYC